MVQYKRKPIHSEPPKHFRNDDEVWVMEVTGEAFGSYEDYLMRLDYYNQRKFTCEITGHTNLTFFEALKSERHGSAEVDSTFPAQLREPILRLVQFSTIGRIDDLVNTINETFKEEFFQGEIVQIQLDDMKDSVEKIEGVVREKASFAEVRFPNGTIDRPAMTRYFVTVSMPPQSEALVDNKHIFRERRSFNKQVIRAFLKHSITRERWEGAPWLVKESLARKYGIDTIVPQALQYDSIMAERKAHAALKKGRPDEQCLEFFHGEIPGLAQATKAYKGKLPQELVMHFQDALAGKVSPSAAKSGFFPNGTPGTTESGRKAQSIAVPPPPPPVTIKYPIEDLHIYPRHIDPRPALKIFPAGSPDSDLDRELRRIDKRSVGALLEIWNTLNVHSALFSIDVFTFDDFVDAMLFRSEDVECELFNEAHCAILKILVDEKGNVDPAVPIPPETDEEEIEEASAETSAETTPAPEPVRQSHRLKKTSLLRNDISEDLRQQENGTQINGHMEHLAEETLGNRSWIARLSARDFRSGGWQIIVVGILHQLTLASKQNDVLQQVLAHLAPIDQNPCQETVRRQYTSLDVNLRIAALEAVAMLAITSRAMKDAMENRMAAMTDMRKDRQHWQREKKSLIEDIHALDEQRRALYPEAADIQGDMSLNGGVSLKLETPTEEIESQESGSDSEDEAPHKGRGRRRISSRANDLKRKREKEDELRREREKKARLEDTVTSQMKSLTRDIQKKEKEIKQCEQQVVIHEERLRVCTCHRTKVLGRDRYWNRYYWFERNGMSYTGDEDGSTAAKGYANGRLWVQGPDDMERAGFIDLPPDEAAQYTLQFGMPLQKRQEVELGATQLHTARDWGYYDTPEAFDKLMDWLDDRGHREKLLRKELQAFRDKIVEQMNVMNAYLAEVAEKKASSEEPIVGIATRKKTYVDHNATRYPCLAWTNSTAKREFGQLHSDGAIKKVGKGGARGKAQRVMIEKPTTRASARLR